MHVPFAVLGSFIAQKIFLNRALSLLFCSAGWIVQGGWMMSALYKAKGEGEC